MPAVLINVGLAPQANTAYWRQTHRQVFVTKDSSVLDHSKYPIRVLSKQMASLLKQQLLLTSPVICQVSQENVLLVIIAHLVHHIQDRVTRALTKTKLVRGLVKLVKNTVTAQKLE